MTHQAYLIYLPQTNLIPLINLLSTEAKQIPAEH